MTSLPSGWALASLDQITDINPRHPRELEDSLPVTFVRMPALSETSPDFQFTEERELAQVRKGFTHFAEGDVLFAKITPCMENGKAAVASNLLNGLGCGTTELHVMRPCAGINSKYLYYFIHCDGFREEAARNFTGTAGQLRVPVDFMRDIKIPLAPANEQRRIVAKLEQLLSRVEATQARLGNIPHILKRFRQSVFESAFQQKGHTKRLDQIFSVQTGGTPKRSNREFYAGGTIPWVKTGEVRNCEILKSEEFITEKGLKHSNAKLFPPGTLLVAMYGEGKTRGQIARLRIEASTNQACAALVNPDLSEVSNQYVYLFLLGQYHKLRAQAVGGNQPNLNLSTIKSWEISFPSEREQTDIVRRVEGLFRAADALEARYLKAKAHVDKLTQSILAKAFRGELVPHDPNDEPASMLLERIYKHGKGSTVTRKRRLRPN